MRRRLTIVAGLAACALLAGATGASAETTNNNAAQCGSVPLSQLSCGGNVVGPVIGGPIADTGPITVPVSFTFPNGLFGQP